MRFRKLACNVSRICANATKRTEFSLPKINVFREPTISGYNETSALSKCGVTRWRPEKEITQSYRNPDIKIWELNIFPTLS
jgi:hypothetical protein